MKLGLLLVPATAAVLFVGAALASPGHKRGEGHGDTAYGQPGTSKQPARIVNIVMREDNGMMEFVPNHIEIRTGEQVKFVIRNNGELDHEFVLATLDENLKHAEEMRKNPDMEHDDPNARRLSAKKSGEIVWKFTKAGIFDFSCLIPGHREAGMFGTVVVK
jgi:uncharacterized cupredoxin-like copper-binding protein